MDTFGTAIGAGSGGSGSRFYDDLQRHQDWIGAALQAPFSQIAPVIDQRHVEIRKRASRRLRVLWCRNG